MITRQTLAKAHGAFNVLTGAWPLVHMRSFEAVLGPKTDDWLVRTVGGLLVVNGVNQFTAAEDQNDRARRIGIGTAGVLAGIDLVYGSRGRISRIYLLDAAIQLGWIALWAASSARTKRAEG